MNPMALQNYDTATLTVDGIGFRVIAKRGAFWLNDNYLAAKNPTMLLSIQNALDHLSAVQTAGPWKSVFCSWKAALTRRESFLRRGATEIHMLAVDLEHPQIRNSCLNAYTVAFRNHLPNLQYYGYTVGNSAGFPKEFLIPRGIPEEAVLANIPAMGPRVMVPIHLGMMEVPADLLAGASEPWDEHIRKWIGSHFDAPSWRRDEVSRMMRAMCVRKWDGCPDED